MQFYFSRHAKRRMKWRKISEKEIKAVLLNPDKIEKQNGKIKAFKIVGNRKLKVIYSRKDTKILIITAIDKSH